MSEHLTMPTDVWWHRALATFADEARAHLRRTFPSIRGVHDDLVSEALLGLTSHLSRRPADAPASWFRSGEPDSADVQRFQKLAYTILNRRISDHFRTHFRRWVERLEDIPEEHEPSTGERDAGSALELKRAARALLDVLANMPEADRELLQQVALGGTDAPMHGRDRQRLRRLRMSLLETLRDKLHQDPIDLIRRL